MSEERLDRIENQLAQVIQVITFMQHNMATKQDLAVVEQNMTTMQQNMTAMQQSTEDKHNLLVQIMTSGFTSLNQWFDTMDTSLTHLSQQVNDINIDLNIN
jgi:predicted HAD superfamily phosphohydrolase